MTRGLDLAGPRRLLDRPAVARLLAALESDGEETRIVGGAVRNALLRRDVTEIDFATTALPKATMKRAARAGLKAVPTGLAHGTVTVMVESAPFEVTTLREDVETDGRHAVVRFGRDFAADAVRRDFTMNALSVGPDGSVQDYTDGIEDLAAGRVRFIGEARARIREDYLRVLRFFRFSADYAEGPLDRDGLAASVGERDGLDILSRERIRAELLKLLRTRRAVEVIVSLGETGLLARLVGAVGEFGRLDRAARRPETSDDMLRLAALLVCTVEDAERLRERLRLSKAEAERLVVHGRLLARLRSEPALDRAEARRLSATFGVASLLETLAVLDGEPRPQIEDGGRAQLARFASGEEGPPVFRLTGADLIRQGVRPGPEIGRLLSEARRDWLDAGCPV